MTYKFTTKLARNICRVCGKKIPKKWAGGIGATCQDCFYKLNDLDLIDLGVIKKIEVDLSQPLCPSYTFEALIDGTWHACSRPCGDWSYVDDDYVFSVPVGWWELDRLYKKHYMMKDLLREHVVIQHRQICELLDLGHSYKCACSQIFRQTKCYCGGKG